MSRPKKSRSMPLRTRRGFALLSLVATITVLFGMFGLAFDLGRAFITKSEVQAFVDTGAMAAITHLDGTSSGIQAANTAATSGPIGGTNKGTPANWTNNWNLDSTTLSATARYATFFNGTYDNYSNASASATNAYRFVKVSASANLPLLFLPVVPGIPSSMTVSATATAGQGAVNSVTNGGLAPFTPSAHDTNDTKNFGLTPNSKYTLKWGNGNTTNCAGDAGFTPGSPPANHGFVDLGQGNGNSSLRGVIVYGGYPNPSSTPSSVSAGMYLGGVPGNRGSSIFDATAQRSAQDPNQTSTTWSDYKSAGLGNGRRIITVAINDPSKTVCCGNNSAYWIIGFANFLLDPSVNISGSSGPICATYIGPGNLNGASSGAINSQVLYSNFLYQ